MPSQVRFSRVVRTYHSIPERAGGTESSRWFTPEEDWMARQAWANDIDRMRRKLLDATTGNAGIAITQADLEECVGIDVYINPTLMAQARQHRQAHIAAILQEQASQHGASQDGCKKLSQVSSSSSMWARGRAHQVAQANLLISERREN